MYRSVVVTCTCNLATLETEFWDSMGSIPGGGASDILTYTDFYFWVRCCMPKIRNFSTTKETLGKVITLYSNIYGPFMNVYIIENGKLDD